MHITLYTKPDCHLCDEVKADLASLQDEFALELEERNILEDAALFERFQYLIPVVEIEGERLLYPPHDWLSLRNGLVDVTRLMQANK